MLNVADLRRSVHVLGCSVVRRGADLRPAFGAQLGIVAAGRLGVDVSLDEDPPVWVPAGDLEWRVLAGDPRTQRRARQQPMA